MTTKFLQANLWNKITTLAKSAKHKHVAVAYLGKGAAKLLPLNNGDTLVVDLRLETVRAGQVNPYEVEEYLKRGVEVFSYANLHAKVFVFDDKAIIGSANVSRHSKNALVESAVLTTDSVVVNSARGFVASLTGAPVTPAYVKSLKKEYHPPKIKGGKRGTKNSTRDHHPRLRIESVYSADFDNKENRLTRIGKASARKKVKDRKRYSVEVIRCGVFGLGKQASFGDLVIQIERDDDGAIWVYPPARIIHLKSYINSNGAQRVLVFIEAARNPKRLKWDVFKAALEKGGVPKLSENIGREISNADLKHTLLGLWTNRHEK